MADTVKLPAIGPVDKKWVYIGGAAIVGFVGYAWWTRARSSPAEAADFTEEDIPQGREPPPTVVGSEDFTSDEANAIINTNAEWYTAAVDYLSSTGGYDFMFVTIALGKFLARRELTEAEANLVQAAKGAVGEPPQGGPWPIIRGTAPGPSTPNNKLATPSLRYSAGSLANTNYALAWTKVTGAAYYIVKRTAGPGAPTSLAVIGTTRRTPALHPGSSYAYRVQAFSVTPGVASSDWSNEVRFTVPKAKAA